MTRSWPAVQSRICLAAKQQCGYEQALNVFKFLCPAGASRARPTSRQHDGNRHHSQRQAHWRPGPLGGLVGHSKDGELSLCRDL